MNSDSSSIRLNVLAIHILLYTLTSYVLELDLITQG